MSNQPVTVIHGDVPPTPRASPPPRVPQVSAPPAVTPGTITRQVDMPSGGLYYDGGVRQVIIRPTSGGQEIAIAGTPEESPERVRAIRLAIQECTDTGGQPFRDMLVLDYGYLAMHLIGMSAGTDEVVIDMPCPAPQCGRPLGKRPIALTDMPCTFLRLRGEDEPGPVDEEVFDDPDLAAAARVERERGGVPTSSKRIRWLKPAEAREPFKVALLGGTVVEWRHHRISDLEATEDYAMEAGIQGPGAGAKLTAYLAARQIVSINGKASGTVGAMMWWKTASSPMLAKLREDIQRREFGFDMRPEFRCPNPECGRKVKVALPNDGSLFRKNDS